MVLAIGILAFAAMTTSTQGPDPCDNYIQNVWDAKFAPGQKWSYRSRPVDAGSTLVVTKIDDVPGIGVVVHVDVDNVDFYDRPPNARGNNTRTEHLAMRRASLEVSVLEMLGIVTFYYNPASFQSWKKNCAARTYATTVADTLTTLQAQYCADFRKHNQRTPPSCVNFPSDSIPVAKPSSAESNPTSPPSSPPASAHF